MRREIVTSFEALRAARRQIAALDEQVQAAAAALEGTREEAIAGARTVLDVLNAELELFIAQIRRERALEQEVVASYRLRAAIGGLTLAGLGIERRALRSRGQLPTRSATAGSASPWKRPRPAGATR